jgi:hypothetical protein
MSNKNKKKERKCLEIYERWKPNFERMRLWGEDKNDEENAFSYNDSILKCIYLRNWWYARERKDNTLYVSVSHTRQNWTLDSCKSTSICTKQISLLSLKFILRVCCINLFVKEI